MADLTQEQLSRLRQKMDDNIDPSWDDESIPLPDLSGLTIADLEAAEADGGE